MHSWFWFDNIMEFRYSLELLHEYQIKNFPPN